MRCICPFDNGSYHMGTICTSRTNRQFGQASLRTQHAAHILSPANEIHFSFRQRAVSHGHDSYEWNESTTRSSVSQHTALTSRNEMHFSIRQRVVSKNVLLVRIDDSIATAQFFCDSYLIIQVYWTTFKNTGQFGSRQATIRKLLRHMQR